MNKIDLLQRQVQQRMKNEPAHDFHHVMRVYKNAQILCKKEKVNEKLVLIAVLLHDIVSYPKSDKRSKNSAVESAVEAMKILKDLKFAPEEIQIIAGAIRDHSFSRKKIPQTIEGQILQDADRLDAIGAIGIARVFAVGGVEKRSFYNKEDPFCKTRSPDDKKWTLDHFYQKLLKLESLMNTKSGKIEAHRRTKVLNYFISEFKRELSNHP